MLKLHFCVSLAIMVWVNLNSTMEINEDQPMGQAKAIYSELAVAQESMTVIYLFERLKSRQRSGSAL